MTARAKTNSERSAERYKRAVRVLPKITLDETHATMLDALIAETDETVTGQIRRMIREQFACLQKQSD